MNVLTLVCLSLSLAADAFVTAVCDGLAYRPKPLKRIIIAIVFGAAQGIMPIGGALLGETTLKYSQARDYAAFAALFIVGVLMLLDGFDKTAKSKPRLGVKTIALQAVATSIDAFACGLTLTTLPFSLWFDGLTIGLITAAVCAVGIFFAVAISKRFPRPERFKIVGGCVLIALALKNLVYSFL